MCSVPVATRCTRIRDTYGDSAAAVYRRQIPRFTHPNTRQVSAGWRCGSAAGPAALPKGQGEKGNNPFPTVRPRTTRARGRYYLTSSQVFGQIRDRGITAAEPPRPRAAA